VGKKDFVVEIGPGLGQLTEGICRKAGFVAAVEIDKKICKALKERLSDFDNIDIICRDLLRLDIEKYLKQNDVKKIQIYANLPYYITTPLIAYILERKKFIDSAYLLVQKEVARRLIASPGTSDYGAISCFLQYHAKAKILFNVSKRSFYPQPEVDSSFMRLDMRQQPDISVKDEELFFRIIRASFGQRRKTLLNSLSGSRDLGLSKTDIAALLDKLKIEANRRGETLSLDEFAKISNALA
jgi:16S rRNA (adenine1518-N6/adenine1519-N6)-dimethyltransferase